nr:6622_t:CDS:2 [Entrophospora candida]CAG8618063.1 14116_t:CDS:2 [Entrophospora candida]
MASNEQQFRESLRSFSWANNTSTSATLNIGDNNNNASPFSRLTGNTSSFFGSIGNRVQGYLPLNNAEVEEPWYALSKWQRFIGFGVFFAGGAFLFLIAFLTLPLLAIKPRKFAATYTVGSVMIIISFALLHGPMAYLKHVTSRERLPFSIAYFGSLVATLYFAIGVNLN